MSYTKELKMVDWEGAKVIASKIGESWEYTITYTSETDGTEEAVKGKEAEFESSSCFSEFEEAEDTREAGVNDCSELLEQDQNKKEFKPRQVQMNLGKLLNKRVYGLGMMREDKLISKRNPMEFLADMKELKSKVLDQKAKDIQQLQHKIDENKTEAFGVWSRRINRLRASQKEFQALTILFDGCRKALQEGYAEISQNRLH